MTFLGIGPGELLLIFILLLVVVGPERLPGMARTFGRGLVRVRNWMQTSPDAALVLRARRELEQELAEIRSSLLEVQNVRDEVLGVAKQFDEAVSPIANTRTTLSDLIKEPADKPLARISNGQLAEPAHVAEAPAVAVDAAQDAAALADVELAGAPEADDAGAGLVLPSDVATNVTPANEPPGAIEELGLRIRSLTAELRAFQDYARSEAALRSAQVEAVMADLYELQKQLKQRGLLADDWQPPSWSMHMPSPQPDTRIEEADR